jgi:ankyrin repeat protein
VWISPVAVFGWVAIMTNAATVEALPYGKVGAAGEGDAQAVTAWLDEGGGVDARCAEEYDGVTLLIAAAGGGQGAMVRMLLQRGAGVNLQDSGGLTALMAAAFHGHTTIVQALLDAKADASLQATDGRTALMFAEDQKRTATAQLLRPHAKRQTAEAKGRVLWPPLYTSAAHAAVAADAMAAELLGEEAAEKQAGANKGKGKKEGGKPSPKAAAAGASSSAESVS